MFGPRATFLGWECRRQSINRSNDVVSLEQKRWDGLPLHELNETIVGFVCTIQPGPAAGCFYALTELAPEACVPSLLVERNASSRNEQRSLQRISQMIPIAMVPMPVNWPTARPTHSAKRVARPARKPANMAYAAMLAAVPAAKMRR